MSLGARWRIAILIDRWFHQSQCWADLVFWAMQDRGDLKGAGLAAHLPWQPIGESCRRDAETAGRCYCGKLGSDGTVLRAGESVCVSYMPGRERNRLCSRPNGHDGTHRCGGIEWGSVSVDG